MLSATRNEVANCSRRSNKPPEKRSDAAGEGSAQNLFADVSILSRRLKRLGIDDISD
jgi:hypothetical protein